MPPAGAGVAALLVLLLFASLRPSVWRFGGVGTARGSSLVGMVAARARHPALGLAEVGLGGWKMGAEEVEAPPRTSSHAGPLAKVVVRPRARGGDAIVGTDLPAAKARFWLHANLGDAYLRKAKCA